MDSRFVVAAARSDQVDAGWRAERARVTLRVDGNAGGDDDRVFELTQVEAAGGEAERSLVVLVEPARHRGMELLTIPGDDGQDEVWMRLPTYKQVKRIVGRKRSSRFLGSEVSLEDLGARSQSRFTHTWLRDEDVAGESCHVVEAVPRDPESGYAKLVLWRELKTLRAVKVAYYAREGGGLVKEAVSSDFALVGGKWWRLEKVVVTNAETGRATTLLFTNRQAGLTLPRDAVSRRRLEQ
jgi:hypothetical protein